MKTNFKKTPLALAVATILVSPLAFANDNGTYDFKLSAAANLSLDVNTTESKTKVEIEKEIKYKQDVEVSGEVEVDGDIYINGSSAAVIDNSQINYLNNVSNDEATNSATVSGNALNNAAGNIGVNVTAGDNNQQANSAALSAADASFVFGAADAEIFARQDAQSNTVSNYGNTNAASLGGNALANASGNIGVNISAGNSNQQKNDLAASVAVARLATATVSVKQMNDHNQTSNTPKTVEQVEYVPVNLAFSATGVYAGISDQDGDQYLDTWSGALPHPSGNTTGHIDVDDQVQGANDRPVSSGLDANGQPNGDLSNNGAFSFNEQGDIALSGTVTGNIPVVTHVSLATTNTSSLSGNALMNATGNIGVNIASGTNNQQFNGLAISATQAGAGGGGGGGGGE